MLLKRGMNNIWLVFVANIMHLLGNSRALFFRNANPLITGLQKQSKLTLNVLSSQESFTSQPCCIDLRHYYLVNMTRSQFEIFPYRYHSRLIHGVNS